MSKPKSNRALEALLEMVLWLRADGVRWELEYEMFNKPPDPLLCKVAVRHEGRSVIGTGTTFNEAACNCTDALLSLLGVMAQGTEDVEKARAELVGIQELIA